MKFLLLTYHQQLFLAWEKQNFPECTFINQLAIVLCISFLFLNLKFYYQLIINSYLLCKKNKIFRWEFLLSSCYYALHFLFIFIEWEHWFSLHWLCFYGYFLYLGIVRADFRAQTHDTGHLGHIPVCPSLAAWLWAGVLISPSLGFFIYQWQQWE